MSQQPEKKSKTVSLPRKAKRSSWAKAYDRFRFAFIAASFAVIVLELDNGIQAILTNLWTWANRDTQWITSLDVFLLTIFIGGSAIFMAQLFFEQERRG